ncbi:hypothetical protein PRIPAC_90856 [Pristionchus pacificus]|nr:hypothetical protein PRIPAC_90856 [Pristionchus pacificus]
MRLPLLLLLQICLHVDAFKFLVYNPLWSQSHTNFMVKLSEVLVEAGHEVVMLAPIVDATLPDVRNVKVTKVLTVPPCPASLAFSESRRKAATSSSWESKSIIRSLQHSSRFYDVWHAQCNATINHPGLLESLEAEHFDAAFLEPMDMCGYGIISRIGVRSFATTMSIGSYEGNFEWTDLPSFPSYVPGMMMQFSDRMTFLQRVTNTLSIGIGKYLFPYLEMPTERILLEQFGADLPSLAELKRATSLWFLNSEPLIEFPRPITHKMIDIGGITVNEGHKELNDTWSALMDLRPQNVLISFGTVAKSYLMPDSYKRTLVDTIKKFPNVTFIWKYEKPEDKISENIANLIEATWLPQIDLLYDPRLSLFITHCGQGSTIEATTAGVPLIVVPIVGDQKRNAAVIARIGTGIVLEKQSLEDAVMMESTLRSALTDDKYRKKASAVGEMIRHRPFSPRATFVKNMEFLARFGPLRMFDHYGQQLSLVQYYLIDVFAFLMSIVMIASFVLFKIVTYLLQNCGRKEKKE